MPDESPSPIVAAIASVPWEKIATAHGNARHVPGALLGLMSDDSYIENRSYWELENYIVLQSDLYEAAYYSIPILLLILPQVRTVAKSLIYDLLYEIANGFAPSEVVCTTSSGFVSLLDGCREEVSKGVAIFAADAAGSAVSKQAEELLELMADWKSDP